MDSEKWRAVRLEEILDLRNGNSRPKSHGSYPIYGGNGILGFSDEFNVSGETIIIGRFGAYCGATYYENEPCWISDNAFYAKAYEGNSTKFLYYLLKDKNLIQFAVGSSNSLLTQTTLNELGVSIPQLYTQEKIALILSTIDDKIENNYQINKILEEISRTLFNEMCLPNSDELPKDWRKSRLGETFETTSGSTPSRSKSEYYDNGVLNWVKSKELGDFYVLDTEEKITEIALKNSFSKLLPVNSILLSLYGATVGEVSILGKQAACNQAICAILPNDDYPYTFIYELIKSQKLNLKNIAVGTAQQNISQVALQRIEIILPDTKRLKDFHNKVEPIYNLIKKNIEENRTLRDLRDNLLPKLMSGEIEVQISN